jgi:hypothetical protein
LLSVWKRYQKKSRHSAGRRAEHRSLVLAGWGKLEKGSILFFRPKNLRVWLFSNIPAALNGSQNSETIASIVWRRRRGGF